MGIYQLCDLRIRNAMQQMSEYAAAENRDGCWMCVDHVMHLTSAAMQRRGFLQTVYRPSIMALTTAVVSASTMIEKCDFQGIRALLEDALQ